MNHRAVTTTWLILAAALLLAAAAGAQTPDQLARASWLLQRATPGAAPEGGLFLQSEIGGGGIDSPRQPERQGGGDLPGLRVLASAIVPGLGEVLGGHWHGLALIGLDAFAWYKVKDNHDLGADYRTEYLAFADEHWSETDLLAAYDLDSADDYRRGIGYDYIEVDVTDMDTVEDLVDLPLWVSKEDDAREYYENLGKWDPFVFGWDDFRRPDDPPPGITYDPTLTISDLRQPWTSVNREKYRRLREASNEAYQTRDRWLYLNIGLRVFSVLEVAYLEGLLGGRGDGDLKVGGHEVSLIVEPVGISRGTLGASVSF